MYNRYKKNVEKDSFLCYTKKRVGDIMKKIICIFLLLCFCIIPIQSLAAKTNSTPDEVINEANSFTDKGNSGSGTFNGTILSSASSTIYNILLAIATIAAVIIGAILGIQFMLASAEDKAKVKESLLPFVVGCVVVFGSFGIWKLVVTFGQSIT